MRVAGFSFNLVTILMTLMYVCIHACCPDALGLEKSMILQISSMLVAGGMVATFLENAYTVPFAVQAVHVFACTRASARMEITQQYAKQSNIFRDDHICHAMCV